MIALIMITALVGAIALLRMDKAEQLGSIIGEFGVEAKPMVSDEATTNDNEPSSDDSKEVDE